METTVNIAKNELYLASLDGWRAIAMLMVIGYHGIDALRATYGESVEWAIPILRHSGIGVHIFFGISGILITHRLIRERESTGRISLRSFYIRRSFRILPPLVAYVSTVFLLGKLGYNHITVMDALRAVGFSANYGNPLPWYLVHTWSLSIEEHFYLVWPVVVLCVARLTALRAVVIMAAVISVWRVADIHWEIVPARFGFPWWRTDTMADFLLLGAGAAYLLNWPAALKLLARCLKPTVTVIVALSVVFIFILWEYNHRLHHLVRLYLPVAIPLVLLGTIINRSCWITSVLELRPLRQLGMISYGCYLWQQLFFVPTATKEFLVLQSWPFNLFATLIVAATSFVVIERFSIAKGKRLSARYATPPVRLVDEGAVSRPLRPA